MDIFDNEIISGRRLKKLNPVTGASISLSSDVLYFAHIAVSQLSEWQPLVIRNSGTVQVGITAYSTNGDYECLGDPISLAPGISTVIQVRFIPTADGLRLGDVHISTDISEGDAVVKLVGVGGEAFTVDDYNLLVARLGEAEGRIFEEETVRVTADTAMAHVVSLIGAKTTDGSAFILNDSTVFVSPDESLGIRLNSINATLDGNTAAISAETEARTTAHTAQSQEIEQINVKVGQNSSAITQEVSARASAVSANAELINTVSARVDETQASITEEQTARVDGDQAIVETLSLLGSKTDDFSAFILNEFTTLVSPTLSLAQKLEQIAADAHNDAGSQIQAAVSDEATARADADSALAGRTTNLETTVSDPNTGLAKAHARVTDETTARSNADQALATRTDALEAHYADPATGNAALQARIAFEENARATAVGAVATRTTSLETSINDPTTGLVNAHSRITTEQTTRVSQYGVLSARAALLLDVNGRVTGWETTNNGATSTFDIIVDKFRVVAPGFSPLAIFTVTGAGVQINGNLLVSGSVYAGQLGDGSMGTFGGNQQYTPITLPSNSVGIWRDIISQVITPQYGRPIFGMANISQRASGGKNGAEQRVRVIRDDGVVVWGVNGGAPNTSTKDGTTSTFTFFDNNPTQGVARTYKLQIALLWADDAVTVADRVLWVEEMSRTAAAGVSVQGSPTGGGTAGSASGPGGVGALAGKDTVTYGTSDVSGFGTLAGRTFVDFATGDVTNKVATNITYTGGVTVDSLKPAQVGADVTLNHTAADYVGRGALANKNTVTYGTSDVTGFGTLAAKANVDLATTDVLNKTATNIAPVTGRQWAAEAGADITGGHVASDYVGRGTLANLNAVDMSTTQVTNKSLANLDATANAKLGGIAPNATQSDNVLINPLWLSDFAYWSGGVRTAGSVTDPAAFYAQIAVGAAVTDQLSGLKPAPPGNTFYFGAWANVTTGGQVQLMVMWYAADGATNVGQSVQNFFINPGWQWLEYALAKPATATQYYCYVLLVPGGKVATPRLASTQTSATKGATASTNLYRSDGLTIMTQAEVRTAEGVAADYTGRGALANLNSVDMATTQVVNKSLANVDATANTKLSGISTGADVTIASQLVVRPISDIQINFTAGGAVAPNQLPMTLAAPLVTKGGVSITGTDNLLTYALSNVSTALGTVTVDNTSGSSTKGSITLANTPAALTGAGSMTLTVSYNGTVISIMRVSVTILQAQQATGGGGGTSGNTGTIGDTVGASYVQVGSTIVGLSVSGGKSIRCSYGGNYQVSGFSHSARGTVKFRYAPTGTTSYSDIGTPAQGSISSRGSQQTFDEAAGSVNYAQNVTPATGTYDVSMWATSDGWNITFDGMSSGSVVVS